MKQSSFNREKINEHLYPMYDCYNQYKLLHKFYMDHINIKGEEELRNRIDYITKHKINQRSEIETILWVIGETMVENDEEEGK